MSHLPNKLTPDYLQSLIESKEYVQISDRSLVCIIHLKSGYDLHGISSVMDKNNFSKEIGEEVAYKNAFDKLWELESYHIFRMKESNNGCCCQ